MKKRSDLSVGERPESKVLERGVKTLSDIELLATFLGSGVRGANVKQIASELLGRFGCKLFILK